MQNVNYKRVAMRVIVTFVQAMLAYLVVADGFNKAVVAGAIGSGLSVVWNTVLLPMLTDNDVK